ncbi:GntR family transcriptional regulator [Pseudonocardia nigra]|uniref:GntR family transcriptional regulator n=1 Tax=Pseudonocardia nigra TaxID=1921578 RepID=UPI001C5F429F|nr:GntR family transcriptional regulator [Pseudonocardia nigra]
MLVESVPEARVAGFSRPQTAQQAVLAEIRGLIIRGEIPPGAPIGQEGLAERFGVSRVPVREALKILEGEGHITYTAHRGYTVTRLEVSDLLEVYRLRALLESDAASEAVPRIEDEHLARMRQAMDAMDDAADAKDMVKFSVHNRVFHFAVLEPSGMTRAIRMIRHLWDTTDPYRSLYFVKPLNRETMNSEHAEILEACRARDVDLVVRLLNVHRNHAVDDLRAQKDSWSA